MRIAIATQSSTGLISALKQADRFKIFYNEKGRFRLLEIRSIGGVDSAALLPGSLPIYAIADLLSDCQGLIARSIDLISVNRLRERNIYPLEHAGWGPHGQADALEFIVDALRATHGRPPLNPQLLPPIV